MLAETEKTRVVLGLVGTRSTASPIQRARETRDAVERVPTSFPAGIVVARMLTDENGAFDFQISSPARINCARMCWAEKPGSTAEDFPPPLRAA